MFSYEALYENRKNEAGFVFNFSLSILFNRPRNSSFLCIMYIYPTQYPCKVLKVADNIRIFLDYMADVL